MSADYDGQQYVGVDLHRRRSVNVRMDEAGNRLETVRVDNDLMALSAQIARAGEHPQVVLEATYGWYWAVDVLQDAGAQVHLAHPLGVKGFAYRRVKNDVRDAADLADLLRVAGGDHGGQSHREHRRSRGAEVSLRQTMTRANTSPMSLG